MRHLLLSPAIDMISTLRDMLLQKDDCMQDAIIVFPGKRPIHFLRKSLATAIGSSYRSPHMYSMDEFIDSLYELCVVNPFPQIAEIDSIPILFTLNNVENMLHEKGSAITLDDFMPWGFKLFGDFEELLIENIDPSMLRQVEGIIQEKVPRRIQDRMNTLSRLYALFYDTLKEKGLSTRSSRYRNVAETIDRFDLIPYSMIIFAGFFALTSTERTILHGLLKSDKTRIILQKGPRIEKLIEALGIDIEEKSRENSPDVRMYKAMDVHGEVMRLSHHLSSTDAHDEQTVIVLPQADTLFPVIQHSLGFVKSSYNISMGYPLYRTPLYALIDGIGKLLESKIDDLYHVPQYLKVMLHPYVKNILFNRSNEPTRIIFHTIEEVLQENRYRLISLDDIEYNNAILSECLDKLKKPVKGSLKNVDVQKHIQQIHGTCIRAFEHIETIHDFCKELMSLLSFFSLNSTANRHPYTGPFIKTMLQAIHDLQTSALAKESFKSTSGYFKLFRNYIRRIRYPFTGTPVKGLQVLGPLETRNLQFKNAYIMDVNEGVLPNTKKEDTILPYKVRTYLGLPTHEQRELISKYYFETLINGCENAHIFYCEGDNKEKSRFVERLEWIGQQRTGVLKTKTDDIFFSVLFKQSDPRSIGKSMEMITYLKNSVRYNATNLNAYLHCPMQFYYARVLNLSSKQAITADIDPADRGSIVHAILEDFFVRKVGSTLTITDKDHAIMEDIIKTQFERVFPYSDQGALYLFKHQVIRRMRDVLNTYAQSYYQDTTILECENRTSPGKELDYWHALYTAPFTTSRGNEVMLSGKIDRVDKRGDQFIILDYKTGSREDVPKQSFDPEKRELWHRTLFSVQLPLYIILYQNKYPELGIEDVDCGLVLLGTRAIKEVFLFAKIKELAERQQLFAGYTHAISYLIDEILDIDIPFSPAREPALTCPGCDFQVLCGTQYLVGTRK